MFGLNRSGRRKAGRSLAEVAIWSIAGVGAWLLTLSSITLPELCIAAAMAVPCALVGHATRMVLGGGWSVRARWMALPATVLVTAAAEVAVALRAGFRGRRGRFEDIVLDSDVRPSEGRAAVFMLATSATPGSLVVHDDTEHRRFALHRLVSAGSKVDAMIPKVVSGGSVVDR
jgi:hypothetical protein